jgi:hypothetical protein
VKTLGERISEVSFHLQSLNAPEFRSQVQDAAERKDKNLLVKVCREAKIPRIYLGTVVSAILSVQPDDKYPATF